MGYQGRSTINDVVRSVMSAAMLSPAMLVACGTQKNNPQPPTTDPTTTAPTATETATGTATATPTATATATTTTTVATATATTTATAPTATATGTATAPDVMVHPSTRPRGNGKNMPTRGFAGAVRARR